MEKIEYNQIRSECLIRWKYEDERIKYFSDKFGEWFKSIPKGANEIFINLLSRFCYYPHRQVNEYLVSLHSILIKKNNINDNNTIFISIKTDSGIGSSSNDYWVEYKLQNCINKYICFDDINKLTSEQSSYIQNVVIIDDCSGSGGTLIKYLNKSNNFSFFKDKKIFFIAIHVMKEALLSIEKFSKEKNLEIRVIYMHQQDKAFNDKYFEGKAELKNEFICISKNLKIDNRHILGFEDSEGLFAFYNNTPNNTLGVFWCNTEKCHAIFPRKNDEKPMWWNLKGQRKHRKNQNFLSAKGGR